MEHKKRNGHNRHTKRLLGLLMALAMLGVLFLPVYAASDSESTDAADMVAAETTYNFYVNDAVYNTQTVKDGEELQKPADPAPAQETDTFAGWFTAADETGEEFTAFGPVTVEETKTIDLYAHWTTQPAEEQPTDEEPTSEEETPTTTPEPEATQADTESVPAVQAAPDVATVTIANSIETNGRLTAVIKDSSGNDVALDALKSAGYTLAWKKNDVNVQYTKVTGDIYNMDPDGAWVNVVYDGGAQAGYTVAVTDNNGNIVASSNSVKVDYYNAIQNGGFESPTNTNGYQEQYANGKSGLVWRTTGPGTGDNVGKDIEIVNTSTADWSALSLKWHAIAKAAEGNQYAELNAEAEGSLYQDVLTAPGATMYWQLQHSARVRNGDTYYYEDNQWGGPNQKKYKYDTMYVVIMNATQASSLATDQSSLKALAPQLAENYSGTRTDEAQRLYAAGARSYKCTSNAYNKWIANSGSYVVPQNQFLTRYFFVSTEYASGNSTVGNQIDNVYFDSKLPPPLPGSGRVTVTKKVYGLSMETVQASLTQNFIKDSNNNEITLTDWSEEQDENNIPYISASYVIDQIQIPANGQVSYSFSEDTAKAQVDGYTLTADSELTKNVTVTEKDNDKTVVFTNRYVPNTANLTVSKLVSGGLGDKTKRFLFSYSYGSTNGEFVLANGNSIPLMDIPVGTVVTITEADYETNGNYTTSYSTDGGTNYTQGRTCTITIAAGDNAVIFKNHKDVTPDTGVLLDSMPYVIILIAVAAGVAGGVVLKRRNHREDD